MTHELVEERVVDDAYRWDTLVDEAYGDACKWEAVDEIGCAIWIWPCMGEKRHSRGHY
jgi:hypothetical protein